MRSIQLLAPRRREEREPFPARRGLLEAVKRRSGGEFLLGPRYENVSRAAREPLCSVLHKS
ncbi:MAG: hypothetical protein DMG08_15065 [Acidobacteria bacterium]|nr:MAG: hypothetical protein DMG08_15065 [Acidobacteriota bacterium]PYV37139.1 MAG: hypothetical protein DMG09_15490 [Acidobacteriota bacterium]